MAVAFLLCLPGEVRVASNLKPQGSKNRKKRAANGELAPVGLESLMTNVQIQP